MWSILRCSGLIVFASAVVIRASDVHAQRPDQEDFASIRAWVESQPQTFENDVLFTVKDGEIVRSERFTTAGAIFGDFDGDGDVDLYDYLAYQICLSFSGPGIPTPPACYVFDSDEDVDIDLQDVAVFNTAFTGPLGGVFVEAGSLFPALASPDGYYSGEPGTSGSNALRGIARQRGYTQDDLWYEWSVIGQPVDSGEVIIANRSLSATPYMVLSPFLVGEYVFNLTVTNLFTGESGFDVTALRGVECLTDDDCNDGDPCTMDVCTDTSCPHAPVDCDDGLFCNGAEFCDPWDGSCVSPGDPCQSGRICIENADTCADELPVELVGQWGGEIAAVAVLGRFAYVGIGPRVAVFDVSNPAEPILMGRSGILPGLVWGLAVGGDYAYVANGRGGLQIINVADPAAPYRVASYDVAEAVFAVALSGNLAFLANSWTGLDIVDVANPTAPREVGRYETSDSLWDLAIAGDYAYVGSEESGLHVIDIADPTEPRLLTYFDTGGPVRGVYIFGQYAYIADFRSGLNILDLSNPADPYLAGSYSAADSASDVQVSGSYAYVANGYSGLHVIDITEPTAPSFASTFHTGGYLDFVAVSGSHAYACDDNTGLHILNFADPLKPYRESGYDSGGYYGDGVAVSGAYAFLASYASLDIINVASPSSAHRVGTIATQEARDVAVSGSHAYIADGIGGLQIVDITNPSDPIPLTELETVDASSISLFADYAWVCEGSSGSVVVDVADPANPLAVGAVRTDGYAVDVAMSGPYAYVANYPAGLQVFSVAAPSNPFYVGGVHTGGFAWGVATSGEYAFVADIYGLQVIDISSPVNPLHVAGVPIWQAYKVAVAGHYAYVAGRSPNIHIVNIADPRLPYAVGHYDTSGDGRNIAILGDYAYVGDGRGGLAVLSVGALPNDTCDETLPVEPGTKVFRNVDATTADVPPEASCPPLGSDVWYTLTASYTGTATVSLCGSDFDTMIAVYAGTQCQPSTPLIVCVDDSECDGELTVRSKVSFPVTGGERYLLRIGGYNGDQGLGVMEISVAP